MPGLVIRPYRTIARGYSIGEIKKPFSSAFFSLLIELSTATQEVCLTPADKIKVKIIRNRRERDSNPRYGFPYNAFRKHPYQPLRHPSSFLNLF